ncbi:MAG: methionine--tRNA ligase [Deltaproteobacteria bacterium]|nr:methionine--tRNA ligase [Deltaproteobacteria bacterium]MCK5709730.1 methionine--tRNA ligase [Deltaproteobacteria bacterium]
MSKTFYVTTPIYYVNDVPHIGHAYTTIAADVIARFKRLQGNKVFFLTGTDEHGQKIERTAESNGEKPIELADRVVKRFQNLSDALNITNDDFIRTTEERHRISVEEIFRRVEKAGDIYLSEYEGWYDVRNEAFITETQLEEIMDLPEEKRPIIEKVKEESYFFRLSKYQEPLLEYYKDHPDFVSPSYRLNEVVKFVEGGLRDLSISRTTFTWGIAVPGNPKHVIYVWFDALTNYLTGVGFPDNEKMLNANWPADVHLVGKDILRFHAVYWPAFLMSAGILLPKKVFAHGWWTVEGEKMSKSVGNVVDPYQVVEEFGADVFRYFLMREIPFGQDGDFSKNSIIARVNGELANGLGNLVSRTLGMIEKYFDGKVPEPGELKDEDESVRTKALSSVELVEKEMDEMAFHKALVSLWDFIGDVNKYVDESAPWILAKEKNEERLGTVLWTIVQAIGVVTILIYPFMPESAEKIWERLGSSQPLNSKLLSDAKEWGIVKSGQTVEKGQSLFPRFENK